MQLTAAEAVPLGRTGASRQNLFEIWHTKIKNFEGATGTWSFDANGDTTNQTMSGNVVKVVVGDDGKRKALFEFVKPLKK